MRKTQLNPLEKNQLTEPRTYSNKKNNFCYELLFIDRGNHLKRRKEIYEILNPETKKGVAGGIASGISRSKGTTAPSAIVQKKSFVEATIIKTGFSKRKIIFLL